MNGSYIGEAELQSGMPNHTNLVFKIKHDRWDAGFFKFSYVGQLPPYRATSPADPHYYSVRGFNLLIGHLERGGRIRFLGCPVHIRIIHLQFFL